MSESIEMYLVTTALLQKDEQPVPLSMLAQKLAISPVSANEMCRKLVERGLIDYQPYKGVTLTTQGESVAQRVLGRRRLWEIFLVDKLGIEADEAEEIACQLEHITSDKLVEHLARFLEHSPQHLLKESCPQCLASVYRPVQALTTLAAGQRGEVVSIVADAAVKDFLYAQGLSPGSSVEVLAVGGDGSLLLRHNEHHLSVAHTIAAQIAIALATDLVPGW